MEFLFDYFPITDWNTIFYYSLILQKTLDDEEIENGSELLPENWNSDENNYALRYTCQKQLYILLGLRTEGSLIITLLDAKSRKVSNIALSADELVVAIKGSIQKMIPTASSLVDRYRKELLEPVNQNNDFLSDIAFIFYFKFLQ